MRELFKAVKQMIESGSSYEEIKSKVEISDQYINRCTRKYKWNRKKYSNGIYPK